MSGAATALRAPIGMRFPAAFQLRWRSLRGASAILLAALCLLQIFALLRAPALSYPEQIAITLHAGEAITVGSAELAAPQADRTHLGLRRDRAGAWWVANASPAKQLVLQRDGVERRSGSAVLRPGQVWALGAARFSVRAIDADGIAFDGAGGPWRYDGARLFRGGVATAVCPDTPLSVRAAGWWNALVPRTWRIARPLSFGGNLYCGNRLGIADVDPGSASIALDRETDTPQFLLSGAAGSALLLADPGQDPLGGAEPARQEQALAGVGALVVGHTRFAVHLDDSGATLALRPLGHVSLYPTPANGAAPGDLPPQLRWQWHPRSLWNLPGGRAWGIGGVLALAMLAWLALAWQHGRLQQRRARALPAFAGAMGTALLAIAGLCALLLQRAGTPPGAGFSALLGCAALASVLLLPGRVQLAGCAAVLLLAIGLLSQLDLGLGAMDSAWLRHYQKTTALLAIALGVGGHLRLRWYGSSTPIAQSRLEWLLLAYAAVALIALAVQVLLGDETGVFDLQPVELAKLALTALSAHCLAVGMGWSASAGGRAHWPSQLLRCCRLAAPALLFAALLALALVEVDDFSPLILLLVWSTSMGLAWAVSARRLGAVAALLLLALAAVGAITWLRLAGAAEVAGWSFYADRFLVWLDPARHPHTGQQLLLGARAIADGGWLGADGCFGLASLGQSAGSALHIPQVQDDFAPAWFLHRHGLAAALVLWLLQVLFLIGVLQTAARAHALARAARDFRQAWLGRFCCFTLCGGAAFVLGHFLLSWGTNLAIFPIMGQPMSFLSAGGSHLLFFICPLLTFTAISANTFEEIQACRSMSNTKC